MKYDLDEVFNSIKQKHWWILCILCIPSGYYTVVNSEALIQYYSMIFQNSYNTIPNMQSNIGLLLLCYLCLFLIYGYLVHYIKSYSEDIYYQEKEPNFVLYLITGLKLVPFSIFSYLMSILVTLIPAIVLCIISTILLGFVLPIGIISITFTYIFMILFVLGYMFCSFLLFVKTNKIISAFRLPTIFNMLFSNKLAIIKACLWIAVIFLPIFVIQISLMVIASIPLIFLPIWIFITYCYCMFSANILAQLLSHISHTMGDELY